MFEWVIWLCIDEHPCSETFYRFDQPTWPSAEDLQFRRTITCISLWSLFTIVVHDVVVLSNDRSFNCRRYINRTTSALSRYLWYLSFYHNLTLTAALFLLYIRVGCSHFIILVLIVEERTLQSRCSLPQAARQNSSSTLMILTLSDSTPGKMRFSRTLSTRPWTRSLPTSLAARKPRPRLLLKSTRRYSTSQGSTVYSKRIANFPSVPFPSPTPTISLVTRKCHLSEA